jgi:peptidoglycan/xylan/chitin deacetylase (PgdA/CDA1 family)
MISNFLFHRVNPERDLLWDPMDVELFDRCIQHISKKYKVVLLEDLVNTDELYTKNEYATIMFDDGYKDNLTYAAPILKKYNCKASFYVVTDCIDKNIPTWTHILEYLFQFTNIKKLDLTFDFLPTDLKVENLDSKEDRINYAIKLKPFLKKISHQNRTIVLNRIADTYTDIKLPKLMMNWDDLKSLIAEGHYIGSHTVTHCSLATLQSKEDLTFELLNSGKRIEEMLGYFPASISYPVGSFNEQTKHVSQEVGYKIGLAVKQNIYDPNKDDRFEISRIELYNESWFKTKLRISNTLENIKTLIGYKPR